MRPGYYELLQLNPLLAERSPEEVEALIDAIEECGYKWDPLEKRFYNHEIFRFYRVQGLDMFTPEKFKKYHNKFYQEFLTNPGQYKLHALRMAVVRRWVQRLSLLLILNLLLGWLILPMKYWLWSLAFMILLGFFLGFLMSRKKKSGVDTTRPRLKKKRPSRGR